MDQGVAFIAVAITIVVPAIASAIAQGWTASTAMQGMARQPEAASNIRSSLLLSLAMIEALTLFALVIALLLWSKL
ncbi:MAG TPA: ATP synthase F0 subunit C [Firmicutes bacterium]|jgi:F-type H+-transporting ATPase subunit c|nr:ATP synthase F0 subunit C [Bacillota bacterium]